MKQLITLVTLILFSFQMLWAAEVGLTDQANKKFLSIFAKKYKQMIYVNAKKLNRVSPTSIATKFKSNEDRGLYQKMVVKSGLLHFPKAVYTKGQWMMKVSKDYTVHYSYLDVAQGAIWVNNKKFQMHTYSTYTAFVEDFKKFFHHNFNTAPKTSWLDLFLPSAHAWISAKIEDILLVSVSGHISVSYEEADFIHDDDHYAGILVNTLVKELDGATSECHANKSVLSKSAGVLSDQMKEVIDSLKTDRKMDETKIVSSLMMKHAKNKNDLYWTEQFRKDHPECLTADKAKDKRCINLKDEYYIDDTPMFGTVQKDVYAGMEVAHRINMDTRMHAQFDSHCEKMMTAILPRAYMPDTKELYAKHTQKVCKRLNALKSCLKEVSAIDDQMREKRGIWADQIEDRNTHFDKFRGSESMSR